MEESVNKMKILYIVARPLEINTSASIRNRATIMGLVENGHQVHLVTTMPDQNHMAYDNSLVLTDVKTTYIKLGGIQSVARLGRKIKFMNLFKNFIVGYMNAHNLYDNLKGIVDHVTEIDVSNYDMIISSSDPKSSHLFAEKLIQRNKFNGKWIQIWGDPFLTDITLSKTARKRKIYKEEKRLLSACDKIVYVSKMTLKIQKKVYAECAEKMTYVPIPYLNKGEALSGDHIEQKKVRLAYCGDYTSKVRNIMPLYMAALEDEKNFHLIICGNSDLDLCSTSSVKVLGRQTYKKVEEIEKEATILVHICNLQGSQIPGKIYQYSGSYKPILFILDGNTTDIREQFEKYGRYYFAENTKEDISRVIRLIVHENKQFYPVHEFEKKVIADKILDMQKEKMI